MSAQALNKKIKDKDVKNSFIETPCYYGQALIIFELGLALYLKRAIKMRKPNPEISVQL